MEDASFALRVDGDGGVGKGTLRSFHGRIQALGVLHVDGIVGDVPLPYACVEVGIVDGGDHRGFVVCALGLEQGEAEDEEDVDDVSLVTL